jgi:hypothetical protein
MTRAATGAIFGALAVVVAWTAWSTLDLRAASETGRPVDTDVADAAPPSAGAQQATPMPAEQAHVASAVAAPAASLALPPAPPPLRDGLVVEHGMPMAVHALAGDADPQAPPPPTAALPPGAQAEDAIVNRAGMVTLTRSAATPIGADTSQADVPRLPAATHVP